MFITNYALFLERRRHVKVTVATTTSEATIMHWDYETGERRRIETLLLRYHYCFARKGACQICFEDHITNCHLPLPSSSLSSSTILSFHLQPSCTIHT